MTFSLHSITRGLHRNAATVCRPRFVCSRTRWQRCPIPSAIMKSILKYSRSGNAIKNHFRFAVLGFSDVRATLLTFGRALKSRAKIYVFGCCRGVRKISVDPFHIFRKELSTIDAFIKPFCFEESVALVDEFARDVPRLLCAESSLIMRWDF